MTAQEIWQLQALEAPRVSAAYMRHRMRDLARRTQIRKGWSYAIGVPGVVFIAWSCWRSFLHRPVMVAGLTHDACGAFLRRGFHRVGREATATGNRRARLARREGPRIVMGSTGCTTSLNSGSGSTR